MKILHSEVTRILKDVNDVFGYPLLMKFLMEFVNIVCIVHHYAICSLFSVCGVFAARGSVNALYSSVVILGHLPVVDVVLIVTVCELIYAEQRETTKLIQGFMKEDDKVEKDIVNLDLKNSVVEARNEVYVLDNKICVATVAPKIEHNCLWVF